jgi:regulator of cell morphogenesis and NO signaling
MSPTTVLQTVGDVAAAYPLAVRVFDRYGIDFCCGGARDLVEACAAAGISVKALLDEVRREGVASDAPESWRGRPLGQLIDHILERYHRPLDTELPRLEALAAKVLAAHGPKDPERFTALLQAFQGLRAELEPHMAKEEQVLFPWIRSGRGQSAGPPIRVMLMEHDSAAEYLAQLRKLTDDYKVPAEACPTWRALYEGLEAFETELKQHIHLENNVLFPGALQGA